MRNMTVPLGCLKSKQGNRLVIYSPHYTFSAFQKALEKGPTSARSNCKHHWQLRHFVFQCSRAFSLGPGRRTDSLGLFRKEQTEGLPWNQRLMDQWSPLTRAWLGTSSKATDTFMASVPQSPVGPQAQSGWTWGTEGTEQVIRRHMLRQPLHQARRGYLFTRFQKCWKAEELMTLTPSSSSRYREIMTTNQWLENQESWLEALLKGKRGVMLAKWEKHCFKVYATTSGSKKMKWWISAWRSHEMKLRACSFAWKNLGLFALALTCLHQNIFWMYKDSYAMSSPSSSLLRLLLYLL